ncbi:MAG: hypothetical protein Q8P59_04165, partial [Dehalococcoidia bacterium]|nr:hypothetical protein [Dehalococcoidia bacterium]
LVRSAEDWLGAFEPFRPHSLTTKTAARLIEGYSPDEYLFSHNTIIASVDVDADQDFMITPETLPFINDNVDAWERGVLANDWRTFIGAENYLEHVQISSLSKGKVVDAALRDVGESLYVDILVATSKVHDRLITRIQTGDLNAMSMGCVCDYTICSKCGNKAVDEVELCSCIRYGKGNSFLGSDGHQRKAAELCGHRDDPGSVRFIEASWVDNPAFRGAVTRNLLTLAELEKKAACVQFFIPSNLPDLGRPGLQRAATRAAADPVRDEAESYYTGDDTLPPEAGPSEPRRVKDNVFDYLYYDDAPSNNLTKEYTEENDDRPFDVEKEWESEKDFPIEFLEDTIVHSRKSSSETEDFLRKYRSAGLTESQLMRVQEGLRYYREGGFRRAAQAGFKGVELLSLRYFMERFRPSRAASRGIPVQYYGLVKELKGLSP